MEARNGAGLTQRGLGELLKRPHTYVAKIEGGERGIDPIECIAWAKACGVSPREFYERLLTRLDRRVWKP
jgi:Helix-turn-helix.